MGSGAALAVSGFVFSAIVGALVKVLLPSVGVFTCVFFQHAIGFMLLIPWALREGSKLFDTDNFLLHLTRAFAGLAVNSLTFTALGFIPLLNMMVLANATPMILPLVAWIWTREQIGWKTWLCIIVGFGGVLLIAHPGSGTFRAGSALAGISTVFSAYALISIRRLWKTENALQIIFFNLALLSLLSFAPMMITRVSFDRYTLALLALMGLGWFIHQLFLIAAYKRSSPTMLAPFNYSSCLFGGLIGWWFFDGLPDRKAVIGISLICVSGLVTIATQILKEIKGSPEVELPIESKILEQAPDGVETITPPDEEG